MATGYFLSVGKSDKKEISVAFFRKTITIELDYFELMVAS